MNKKNEMELKASHSPEGETVRPRQLDVLLIRTQLVSKWVNCEHIPPNSESSIFSTVMPTLSSSYHPNEEHHKGKSQKNPRYSPSTFGNLIEYIDNKDLQQIPSR